MNRYLLILMMLLFSTAAIAGTNKWTDANGNVHYSGQPPPGGVNAQALPSGGSQTNNNQANNAADEKAGGYSSMDNPGGQGQISSVGAVPYLTDGGRARYREFLTHASPRAFVVCRDGTFSTIYGERAHNLSKQDGNGCELYAVDDEVVWQGR